MTSDLDGKGTPEPDWLMEQRALTRGINRAVAELKVIERRLGTPAELPDDMGRTAELAHRVNNLRTTLRLSQGLQEDGASPLEPPVFEPE